MRKVTLKQKAFVKEYMVDRNATQAAIRAGYSAKTAQEQSSRLLSNVIVAAEIRREQNKIAQRVEVTQDMVVEGLLAEAQRVDEKGTAAARVAAWEKLGKWLGIFEKDNKQKGQAVIITEEYRGIDRS